jgi:hypothetical protein
MFTLKDILTVCNPDWIEIGRKIINVAKDGLPENLLDFPVKNITGWDDGLTIELETIHKKEEV